MSDELMAQRLGVRRQQMNVRLRRLAESGLVSRTQDKTQPCLSMLTRRGARAVGLPIRRAARTDAQREHELAIVWLVTELEHAGGARVLTERECRSLEDGAAARYSVVVLRRGRPEERRWPDVVLEGCGRRSAVEVEFSVKGATRLRAIVEGYLAAPWFDEVIFFAGNVMIARTLQRALSTTIPPLALSGAARAAGPKLRVLPWPAPDAAAQKAIASVMRDGAPPEPGR